MSKSTKKDNLNFFKFVVIAAALLILPFSVFMAGTKTNISPRAKEGNSGTQTIRLNKDWNIISFNVTPSDITLANIVKPLIENNTLVMIKDQDGNALWPAYNIDKIGEMTPSEGYQINMTQADRLVITGQSVMLPYTVNLRAGWNIMGYPAQKPTNAIKVFKALIANDVLVKVEDENGQTLEKVNDKWVNKIGTLKPGRGYKINIKEASELVIK